ncbi:MAG: MTH1187 family thiamine-binding protein [Candidatus Omnitrophica bacterium]|nr:MTH1187 family thiamine-binding protein [Candidatus Omnitrophota bacterium]MCM8783265.1 MTH1187 family thiamine-binding protein [Candidatus Omnitrophota bacterium]
MPIMDINIIPIGTKGTSLSKYVACAEKVLMREKDVKMQITAMGTIVESRSLKRLLEIAQKMHRAVITSGAKRVLTKIEIDERRDKRISIESKVKSVKEKFGKEVKKHGKISDVR